MDVPRAPTSGKKRTKTEAMGAMLSPATSITYGHGGSDFRETLDGDTTTLADTEELKDKDKGYGLGYSAYGSTNGSTASSYYTPTPTLRSPTYGPNDPRASGLTVQSSVVTVRPHRLREGLEAAGLEELRGPAGALLHPGYAAAPRRG